MDQVKEERVSPTILTNEAGGQSYPPPPEVISKRLENEYRKDTKSSYPEAPILVSKATGGAASPSIPPQQVPNPSSVQQESLDYSCALRNEKSVLNTAALNHIRNSTPSTQSESSSPPILSCNPATYTNLIVSGGTTTNNHSPPGILVNELTRGKPMGTEDDEDDPLLLNNITKNELGKELGTMFSGDISDAVTKILEDYDWSKIPLANRSVF